MTGLPATTVDIAILGGGAAGALVARHLLALRDLRLALVEPRGVAGRGAAYSTARPEHLLNVNAARMSAFQDVPDDFLAFLATRRSVAPADLAGVFAQRRDYGAYLEDRLAAVVDQAGLDLRATSAVDLQANGQGYAIRLADGGMLTARAVVLALGNLPAALPVPVRRAAPDATVEAWDYDAIAAIDPADDVAIVGAGLSMVDTLLTLQANGHRGRIVAMSRHGLMPLSHAPGTQPQPGGVEALLPLGVRARMHLLRQWAAEAQAEGGRWQDALERLRPHVQTLWQTWSAEEQRRFLRHAVRLWDIHRHRIAPEVGDRIAAMRADGRFRLHAGRLEAIGSTPDGRLRIDWHPRGGTRGAQMTVDHIVNATGTEKRVDRAGGSLLPALLAQGLARPGPHGIGLDTSPAGQVLGADGAPVAGLWTLGALRTGTLWESVAMPELRGQAARLAEAALAGLEASR